MLHDLIHATLKKKPEIESKLIDVEKEIDGSFISSKWIKTNFRENRVSIVAEDGSYNAKKYRTFVLYAISSTAIILKNRITSRKFIDVDVIEPTYYFEEKLKLRMTLAELEMLYKTLNEFNPELALIDGSLIGEIIRPLYTEEELDKLRKEGVKHNFLPDIENSLGKEILFMKKKENELEKSVLDFAEYIEYLDALYHLLKDYGSRLVAISKTSSSSSMFEMRFSDIMLFERFASGEGHSLPYHFKAKEKIKRGIPLHEHFFKELDFTIFYLRLGENTNVLKIEVPRHIKEDEIVSIAEKLKAISVDGYPYLLKKAHEETVIKNRYIEKIAQILGIVDRTGREML
ncbi:MAG: DNA double-strand break repair nuclease NurA [Candidatus Aenigmarchaeota archaeon]|nr:DNA double-strand break repair nuclease NurA [Candidatus Aenigmarchaeota archaeon]